MKTCTEIVQKLSKIVGVNNVLGKTLHNYMTVTQTNNITLPGLLLSVVVHLHGRIVWDTIRHHSGFISLSSHKVPSSIRAVS